MQSFIPHAVLIPRVLSFSALLAALWVNPVLGAQYELLAKTRDKIALSEGKARLGSFGAPAINDKGGVAYACILSGNRVDSLSNNAIVYDRQGKKHGKLAVQSGVILDNSFLPTTDSTSEGPVPDSARMYRVAENVAINSKAHINFAGEELYVWSRETDDGTELEDRSRPTFGTVFPQGSLFQSVALSNFQDNDSSDILETKISISSQGSLTYNALAILTDSRDPLSIFVNTPTQVMVGGEPVWTYTNNIVASVDSIVIGLPFSTTFTDFSDGILAAQNRVFLVADISDTGDEFDGIWQGTNPNLKPVVVKGTQSPTGGEFTEFDESVAPSPNGKNVAFVASLSGGSVSRGAFRCTRSGKDLILIAAVEQAAPGTTGTFSEILGVGLSNRGQVVVYATVELGGRDRKGIWLSDKEGGDLRLITLEGRTLPVKNEEIQISSLTFNPVVGLNRGGQVVFTASFTNRRSAVYVATR